MDNTDLDSPFDQITRLEDGRFRDSNPIAPKQSISSFRISISPLSVAWIKTEKLSSKTRINHPRIYPIVISRPFLKIQKSQDIFQIIEIKIIDPSFDLYVLPRKKTEFTRSLPIVSNPFSSVKKSADPRSRIHGTRARVLAATSSEVNSWNNCVTVDAFGEEMIAGRISCRGTMRLGVVDTSAENIAPRWWMGWCCNWQPREGGRALRTAFA